MTTKGVGMIAVHLGRHRHGAGGHGGSGGHGGHGPGGGGCGDITTLTGTGPYNVGHIHLAMVETGRPVSVEELRDALWDEPRIAFVRAGEGVVALNAVSEPMRDLDRPRRDMWEVAVWWDALFADDREVCLTFQVHNELIPIPETVDCIRALKEIEREGSASTGFQGAEEPTDE